MKSLTRLLVVSTLMLFVAAMTHAQEETPLNKSVVLIEKIGRAIVARQPVWRCGRGIVTGPRLHQRGFQAAV